MVSKDTLSADLDLVKEIEQLRIKQKLLIDALGRKKKEEHSKQLADLSSKIDFLVEIFKNASKDDDEKEEDKQASLIEKLDEMTSTLEKRFDVIDKKLSSLEKKNQSQSMPPVPDFHENEKKVQTDGGQAQKETRKKRGLFS